MLGRGGQHLVGDGAADERARQQLDDQRQVGALIAPALRTRITHASAAGTHGGKRRTANGCMNTRLHTNTQLLLDMGCRCTAEQPPCWGHVPVEGAHGAAC